MTKAYVVDTHLRLIIILFLYRYCLVSLKKVMLDVFNGSAFDKPISFTNALISTTLTVQQVQMKWKRLSTELLPYINEHIDNSYKLVLSMFVKQSYISVNKTADFNGTNMFIEMYGEIWRFCNLYQNAQLCPVRYCLQSY